MSLVDVSGPDFWDEDWSVTWADNQAILFYGAGNSTLLWDVTAGANPIVPDLRVSFTTEPDLWGEGFFDVYFLSVESGEFSPYLGASTETGMPPVASGGNFVWEIPSPMPEGHHLLGVRFSAYYPQTTITKIEFGIGSSLFWKNLRGQTEL